MSSKKYNVLMNTPRKLRLQLALEGTMTSEKAAAFSNYTLTNLDLDFIKETAKVVLSKSPDKSYNCAAMSAMWGAIIKDHSKIPVSIITGSLSWEGKYIFVCKEPISLQPKGDPNRPSLWDGHCWLEFGGLIADISIFRTIRNEPKLMEFNQRLIELFGGGKGLLCASPDYMSSIGLEYYPLYSLGDEQINALISGSYN